LTDAEYAIVVDRARASGQSRSACLGAILRGLSGPTPEDPRVTAARLRRDEVRIREEQRTARARWRELAVRESGDARYAIARLHHQTARVLAGTAGAEVLSPLSEVGPIELAPSTPDSAT
jgi:hypothetical protein